MKKISLCVTLCLFLFNFGFSQKITWNLLHFNTNLNFYKSVLSAKPTTIIGLSKNRGAAALLNFGKDSIPAAEKDSTLIQQNYTKEEIKIEMRDGVKLFTSIYAPKDKSIPPPIPIPIPIPIPPI